MIGTSITADTIAEVMERSDERELQLRLRLEAWHEGWHARSASAQAEGYAQAEADLELAWRECAVPVSRGDFSDQAAARRVTRAERACEADARRWWDEFHARAEACPPSQRTPVQAQVVSLAAWRARKRGGAA
ncbi:MAG TPA: hypothetical protein VGI64_17795 [Streptosporangiaceae bacterium]|jgi:hypothetical protein